MRTDTRTITVDAPVTRVFAFLTDAANLPRWAPNFASAVEQDDDGWIVRQGADRLGLRIAADADRGTVDLHITLPTGGQRAAYGRVLPNGSGAEFLFTVFHSHSRPDADVARQAAEVEAELRRVKMLCEAG